MSRPVLCAVTSVALFAVTAACSPFFDFARPVDVKAIHTAASDPSILPDEGVYQDAVREIRSRDYASALDFLQVARERSPGDVRVFNAMGVVYDKLGRFDLSTRYYAEASKLAPDSKIVQSNMAYSATLQAALHGTPQPAAAVAEAKTEEQQPVTPGVADASPEQPVQVAQNVRPAPPPTLPQIPVEQQGPMASNAVQESPPPAPENLADMIPPAAKAWTGLSIVDASDTGTGPQLASAIRQRGWTMPAKAFGSILSQRFTTVISSSADTAVAMSIASTLPMPAKLQICDDGCHGIVVVIGADARDGNAGTLRVADAGAASK